jgi:hypothetical protein
MVLGMRGSAGGRRAALTIVLLGVSLCGSVSGCGFVERVTSTPSITELPTHPDEITPTATVPGAASETATAEATGIPVAVAPTSTQAGPRLPEPGGLLATERLIVVESLGIGFAAPTLSTEIDPEKYVEGSAALEELSRVMGLSSAQVRNGLLNRIDRMVTAVGEDGRITSIVVTRIPSTELPTEALVRQGVGATMSGTVTKVDRPTTAAGKSIHAVYRLGTAGDYHYGEAVYLDTAEGAVSVAVTAGSGAEARRVASRVLTTLRTIE